MATTISQAYSANSRLTHIWRWVMSVPHYDAAASTTMRYKATLLQQLVVGVFAIMNLFALALTPVMPASTDVSLVEILLMGTLSLILPMCEFIFNRTGWYRLAALLLIVQTILMPHVGSYVFTDMHLSLHELRWLSLVSILLVSILFPNRSAILLTGLLNAFVIVVSHLAQSNLDWITVVTSVTVISMVTLCTIIIHNYRSRLEGERRTELVTVNTDLQHRIDERERLTQGLTKILSAADELLVAPNLDVLWKHSVELARKHLGIDRCAIYEFNPDTGYMNGTYGTNSAGATVPEHETTFKLVESPWSEIEFKSDKPWAVHYGIQLREGQDVNNVIGTGWNACTAISGSNGKLAAAMFSDNAISGRPFNPLDQDLMGVYCSLLSGIVERKRAEAQRDAHQLVIQESNENLTQEIAEREQLARGLTVILGATNELMTVPSLDHLWRRGVELARERLHLERCSIFEIDAQTAELIGTYGTRSDGTTTFEHDKRLKIADTHWGELIDKNQEQKPWIVKQNIDLHEFTNGVNRTIAWGWLACARITDKGGMPTAVLFHDSALTGRPFDPVEQDLIGLYCSLLGGIIERKRAEMQLENNVKELKIAKRAAEESSRIKSEFLSTVSHELRTPLNAIIGFSDMLLMGMNGELNPKQHHKMSRLRENGVRLLTLINNVLDLSRLEAHRVDLSNKPFSPHDLMERISAQMEVLAQQKGLQLNMQINTSTPAILFGDEQRVEQIVVNLLSNAFKFTDRGSVTIIVDTLPEAAIWRIRVTDTGIGIPPHAINLIFEEFRQVDGGSNRAYKGSGLGLSITRNFIHLMRGQISVDSIIGKGSTFTVTLPLLDKTSIDVPPQIPALPITSIDPEIK